MFALDRSWTSHVAVSGSVETVSSCSIMKRRRCGAGPNDAVVQHARGDVVRGLRNGEDMNEYKGDV
jgi:hypothetical protein